jgi:hypothetical protein
MEQDHVVRDQEPVAVLGTAPHQQNHIFMDSRLFTVLDAAAVHAVAAEDSRMAADVAVGGMGEPMGLLRRYIPLLSHK